MEKGYFAAAWGDVAKSPGWASVLLRLGLLCLVPVFGVVVMYGYLFSWARDIAWNVHRPLPKKIFANEDGSLYKRGFFIFVVGLVFSLVPEIVNLFIGMSVGFSFGGTALYGSYVPALFGSMVWLAGNSASVALSFFAALFFWVGAIRVSLYGTLSSGFQIQKIWAMMKHDFIGLLRIVGMAILIAVAIAFSAIVLALFFALICSGLIWLMSSGSSTSMVAAVLIVLLGAAFLALLLFASALQNALVFRALGYWTRQFDVSLWSGQDDPMPFERNDMQNSTNVSAHQGFVAQCAPTSSHVSGAAYSGESSVDPIPSGVPSGFVQTAPFAGTGEPIAQSAQATHDPEPLAQSSEGNDGTGPQVLESPDDLSSTGGQPQHSETGSQEKSEGESKTN